MGQKGSIIAKCNFFISALLIILAISWPFIQKGLHWYYQREANAFFEIIQEREIAYKLQNSKFLPFGMRENKEQLRKLRLSFDEAEFYDFCVIERDRQTFLIMAQLKPDILKKWYFNSPAMKTRIMYLKREGEAGEVVKE